MCWSVRLLGATHWHLDAVNSKESPFPGLFHAAVSKRVHLRNMLRLEGVVAPQAVARASKPETGKPEMAHSGPLD